MLLVSGVVTISTIVFYTSEKAVLGISVASTLISIILAVLAIVYTYIDSSSQKENTRQMRESAQKLAESVEEAEATLKKFSDELINVSSLKDELIEKITDTQEWRETVLNQLKTVAQQKDGEESVKMAEIEKVILMNKINNMTVRERKIRSAIEGRIYGLLVGRGAIQLDNLLDLLCEDPAFNKYSRSEILTAIISLERDGRLVNTIHGYCRPSESHPSQATGGAG